MTYCPKQFIRLTFIVGIILAVGLVSVICVRLHLKQAVWADDNAGREVLPVVSLQPAFYDEVQFRQALSAANDVKARADVAAIVVPHHLVGAELIAKLMRTASGRAIERIFIIGPNHGNIGQERTATVLADWQTPGGLALGDRKAIMKLMRDQDLLSNPAVFRNEHAIGAEAPFIKNYFPDARIVPIALSSYAGQVEAEMLSAWLEKEQDEKTLVIFSLDFSHYLTKAEADQKDEITAGLIQAQDIDKILKLDNDYVDSPAGLATAVLLAGKLNLKTEITAHANSYDFATLKPSSTTSYFGIVFSR